MAAPCGVYVNSNDEWVICQGFDRRPWAGYPTQDLDTYGPWSTPLLALDDIHRLPPTPIAGDVPILLERNHITRLERGEFLDES